MHKQPLVVYVIAVIIVWVIILSAMWFTGNHERFRTFALICMGFLLGMLAMYIAMHVYN